MRNIRAALEYDGTDFHGFQRQPQVRTVQGVLEESFSRLLDEEIRITGAGRTDAGVHATGQVVNFRTSRPIEIERFVAVLNGALPEDVKVQQCEEAEDGFHARRSARSRTYCYTIIERPQPSPIIGRFALVMGEKLEAPAMQAAGAQLLGRHDFAAFQAAGSDTMTTERTLYRLECLRDGSQIEIIAEADSFLYQMVRIIVGGLIQVGLGEREIDVLAAALSSGQRVTDCPPAAACGLCLTGVSYETGVRERITGLRTV